MERYYIDRRNGNIDILYYTHIKCIEYNGTIRPIQLLAPVNFARLDSLGWHSKKLTMPPSPNVIVIAYSNVYLLISIAQRAY